MKTFFRILSLVLVCMMVAPILLACGGGNGNTEDTTTVEPSTTPADTTTAVPEVTELTLFDDGATDYTILRPDSEEAIVETRAAVTLSTAFKEATGKVIKITTDWKTNPVSDYEICIGEVARMGEYYDIDTASLGENQFIVKAIDSRIVILGKTTYGTRTAVEWFVDTYFKDANGESLSLDTLKIEKNLEYIGTFEIPSTLRIMTQNLLATDTEYEGIVKDPNWASRIKVDLSQHTLAVRQPRILALIEAYQPDSLGVQECSATWRNYFDANLKNIGYRRIGANKNEKIGIIYNMSTVKPVDRGSIWLTENPEKLKISTEWGSSSDGLTERLAMYVVFEVIATGERYIHFNTHLETGKNSIIQVKQTEVLLNYIETICAQKGNLPAVVTGDFNYNSSSSSYTTLMSSIVVDAKYESAKSTGTGSFNKFIGQSYASLPIDQVLGTNYGIDYVEYKVVYDTDNGCFLSDHYAVYADISLTK